MHQLTFEKFKDFDSLLIKQWIANDEEGQKHLKSYTTDSYTHLIDFSSRYLWIVYAGKDPIGFFDFESKSADVGYFSFYVRPKYRRQGIGTQIIREILQFPEIRKVRVLEGGVDDSNITSIKVLESLGFSKVGIDKDGMFMYQKPI